MSACPTFAFSATVGFVSRHDAHALATLRAELDAALNARGLLSSGTLAPSGGTLVIRGESAQATDADRRFVETWLTARPDVAEATLGELFDLSAAED